MPAVIDRPIWLSIFGKSHAEKFSDVSLDTLTLSRRNPSKITKKFL